MENWTKCFSNEAKICLINWRIEKNLDYNLHSSHSSAPVDDLITNKISAQMLSVKEEDLGTNNNTTGSSTPIESVIDIIHKLSHIVTLQDKTIQSQIISEHAVSPHKKSGM